MNVLVQRDILSAYEGRLLNIVIGERFDTTFIEHPSHIEWTGSSILDFQRIAIYVIKSIVKFFYLLCSTSIFFINPLVFIRYIFQAIRIYSNFSSCNSTYCHLGHDITNVVIDTRIRFSPLPFYQRSIADIYYICSYLQSYYFTSSCIQRIRPRFSLALYACYSQHLGFINACIDCDIPSFFAFRGNLFLSRLDTLYPRHSIDYSRIHLIRQSLNSDTLSYISNLSSKVLASRKSGVNVGQSYMKRTAFEGSTLSDQSITSFSSSIILFLHDFYDSPHIYPGLDYPDFITWAIDTLKFLISTGKKIYVKPHPNQINPSRTASKLVLSLFPQVHVLDASTSNHDIFIATPGLIVTAYGNVAVEAAYYGIKCISAVPFSPASCSLLSTCSLDRPSFLNNIRSYINSPQFSSPSEPDTAALGLSLLSVFLDEDVELSSFIKLSDALINSKRDALDNSSHSAINVNSSDFKYISSFINKRLDQLL